jgi:hypothetical protein
MERAHVRRRFGGYARRRQDVASTTPRGAGSARRARDATSGVVTQTPSAGSGLVEQKLALVPGRRTVPCGGRVPAADSSSVAAGLTENLLAVVFLSGMRLAAEAPRGHLRRSRGQLRGFWRLDRAQEPLLRDEGAHRSSVAPVSPVLEGPRRVASRDDTVRAHSRPSDVRGSLFSRQPVGRSRHRLAFTKG